MKLLKKKTYLVCNDIFNTPIQSQNLFLTFYFILFLILQAEESAVSRFWGAKKNKNPPFETPKMESLWGTMVTYFCENLFLVIQLKLLN